MAVNEDIEITIESEPSQFTELEVIPIYGPTGNGISRIEKTDTSYNVDTYTIYFTNGTTTTFTVTNGISILDIQKTDTTGLVDTYTISLSDGNTHTFTVTNGAGISNIAKTSTSGLVDTYTVTLNNSDSYTFTVTNGKAGTIEIGTVTTGAAGSSASVTNVGTDNEAILDFVIPKGDKGDKGDTGTAATIEVGTTTTGEAGTNASVTNSGTSSAAVFNFTIPKGDKGDTGNTGATGNGVSGTSLLSWEGLVKTYRMSYTNGSYFDFTVENGTGQVDWGGISGVISQQTDLQDVLHSSKGYLDNGTLLFDSTLFNYVYGYNHSTFDRSKFSVVGTPTITDEGVVTTADSSNYAQLNFDFSKDHTFEIEIKGNNSTATTIRPFNNGYQVYINPNNSNRCLLYVNSGASYSIGGVYDDALKTNYTLKLKIKKVGLTYTVNYVINGTITGTSTTTLATTPTYETYIRFQGSLDAQHSVDLKTLKLYDASGYPVFSGNKTGIDTIKPADYTVVGTPTISADGIASDFSSSNYITLSYNTNVNNIEVICSFNTSTVNTGQYILGNALGIFGNGRFFSNLGNGDKYSSVFASANTFYLAKISLKSGQHLCQISTDNGINWQTICDVANSGTFGSLKVGISAASTNPFNGLIDLNALKIYVNGDLVYQPCLHIPYNLSSTGSKIVDVAYRDRVIDVYNQYGSANYYTIDEINENCTLPMGEIYGLIGQRTLRASYRNGINYWEEYSDRTLEQGGSCTSGTTVNLLKPFADTNYVLTVPYSAKTTTSFTPSASGDWIAKGLGE